MTLLDQPIRFSHLRAYGRSAMHGHHSRTSEWTPSEGMLLGTATHALAFGTGKVISYPKTRRGKEWDEFAYANTDSQILTAAQYEKATSMSSALLANRLAVEVMAGDAEQTILFNWYGRKCRATPDVRGDCYVTDLKTCQTSDPEKFVWSSLRFAYHAQMRMQMEAANVEDAYIVAIEATKPYPITVFQLTHEALLDGERLLSLWMERLITCESSDSYPPYVSCIVPLDVQRDVDLEYSDESDTDPEPVPPLEL